MLKYFSGKMFTRDFISEMKDQDHKVTEKEVRKLAELADSDGQVQTLPIYLHLTVLLFQLSRAGFDTFCRESELFASLDKNGDGIVSQAEITSKHEMAWHVSLHAVMSLCQRLVFVVRPEQKELAVDNYLLCL